MVKSHDKFGFDEAKTAHFRANLHNHLNPTSLHLHTQNSRKTDNRFCFWFFASYERSKNANIVLAKSVPEISPHPSTNIPSRFLLLCWILTSGLTILPSLPTIPPPSPCASVVAIRPYRSDSESEKTLIFFEAIRVKLELFYYFCTVAHNAMGILCWYFYMIW